MKRSLVVITGLLVIGTAAALYRAAPTTEPAAARSAAPTPTARGFTPEAAELLALKQELALLKQQVRTHAQQLDSGRPAAGDPADDETAEVVTPEDQDRMAREYVQGVATAFRREPIDAAWSSSKTALVQRALAAQPALQPLVRGVECRSQTCRVELADEPTGRPSNAIQTFVARLGSELPSALAERVELAGRPGATVLYVGHHADVQITVQ